MGVRMVTASSNALVTTTIVTTADTILLISPVLNQPLDGAEVLLFWELVITNGTGTSANGFKLRRGPLLTSTQINVAINVLSTAGVTQKFSGVYRDTPGVFSGLQYSLTVAPLGATGNATVNDGCITALVL